VLNLLTKWDGKRFRTSESEPGEVSNKSIIAKYRSVTAVQSTNRLVFVGQKMSYTTLFGWIACIYRFMQKNIDGYWVAAILDNRTAICFALDAKSYAPVLPLEVVGQEVMQLLGRAKVVKLVNDVVWAKHQSRLEQNSGRSASIVASPLKTPRTRRAR
jgi:hypothetical protein